MVFEIRQKSSKKEKKYAKKNVKKRPLRRTRILKFEKMRRFSPKKRKKDTKTSA